MSSKIRKTAVITGSTGGIGSELAALFLETGMTLYLWGRNFEVLRTRLGLSGDMENKNVHFCKVDLNEENEINKTVELIYEDKIDYLIHGAAFFSRGSFKNTDISELDRSYRVNLRAPYLITQRLLPKLVAGNGVITFLNSSAVTGSVNKNSMHYASTKAAMKSMADCLRQEVNSQGVKVVTYFLGKVATPMQQKACENKGIPYKPEKMILPRDAAKLIFDTITPPVSIEITDLHIRPPEPYE